MNFTTTTTKNKQHFLLYKYLFGPLIAFKTSSLTDIVYDSGSPYRSSTHSVKRRTGYLASLVCPVVPL